jgi:hypothetical protein
MFRFSVRRVLGAGVAGSAVALALTLGGAIPGTASAAPAAAAHPDAASAALAGPFSLAPGETQTQIPTFILGKKTHVVVNCTVAGNIELHAGGSLAETDQCNVGNNEFDRNFGGVFLAVKNDTSGNLTVTTH